MRKKRCEKCWKFRLLPNSVAFEIQFRNQAVFRIIPAGSFEQKANFNAISQFQFLLQYDLIVVLFGGGLFQNDFIFLVGMNDNRLRQFNVNLLYRIEFRFAGEQRMHHIHLTNHFGFKNGNFAWQ